jgi:hypothetical protein
VDIRNLGYSVWLYQAKGAVAAGQTDVSTATSFDLVGSTGGPYDCIMYVASLGTLSASSVVTLKMQANNDNATWTSADVAGSHATVTYAAGIATGGLVWTDIFRITSLRYVRPYLVLSTPSAGNAVVNCIIGIAYNAHSLPITTYDATVLATIVNAYGAIGTA